jgi:hypothetical protein
MFMPTESRGARPTPPRPRTSMTLEPARTRWSTRRRAHWGSGEWTRTAPASADPALADGCQCLAASGTAERSGSADGGVRRSPSPLRPQMPDVSRRRPEAGVVSARRYMTSRPVEETGDQLDGFPTHPGVRAEVTWLLPQPLPYDHRLNAGPPSPARRKSSVSRQIVETQLSHVDEGAFQVRAWSGSTRHPRRHPGRRLLFAPGDQGRAVVGCVVISKARPAAQPGRASMPTPDHMDRCVRSEKRIP